MYRGLLLLLVGFGLSGCSAPVLKVKKMDTNMLAYYTGEGGVVVQSGRNVCVAPPTQAGRALSGKGGGKADVSVVEAATVGIGGDGERDHEVVKLHDLNTSMIYMQHGLYRLCEAQMNGFLEEGEYKDMVEAILASAEKLAEQEAKIAEQSTKAAEAKTKTATQRTLEAKALSDEAKAKAETAKAEAAKAAADLRATELRLVMPRVP